MNLGPGAFFGVAALAFAYPLFRLGGAYFAMATFAMMLLIRHIMLNLDVGHTERMTCLEEASE